MTREDLKALAAEARIQLRDGEFGGPSSKAFVWIETLCSAADRLLAQEEARYAPSLSLELYPERPKAKEEAREQAIVPDDFLVFSMFRARIAEADTPGGEHPYLFDTLSLGDAKRVSAAIDRVLASHARYVAQEEARGGWQPIETAPKDGTEIVALVSGRPYFVSWTTHERQHAEPWWRDREGYGLTEPTHWMPLPPAPTGQD